MCICVKSASINVTRRVIPTNLTNVLSVEHKMVLLRILSLCSIHSNYLNIHAFAAHGAYIGFLSLESTENNSVVHVFCKLLLEKTSAKRRHFEFTTFGDIQELRGEKHDYS